MKRQSTRKPAAQNGPPAPTAARACLARILRQNCVLSGRCSLYESTVRQYRLMFPKLAKPRAENFDLSALDSCRMSPGPGLNVRSLQVGRLPAISPEARGAPCPRSPIKYPPDEESEPQLTDRAQKVPGGVRGSEICDLLLRSPQPQRKKNVSLGNLFGRVPQSVVPWRGKVAKNRVNRDQRRYGDNVHLTTIMCPISIGEMKVTPLLETAPISHSPTPVPSHYLPLKKSSVRLSKPSASFQTLSVVPPAIDDLDDPKTTISGIESVVEEGKCCARLKPPMAESGAHHQNSSVNLHISKEDDEDQIILDDMLAEEADADSPIGKEAVNQTVPQKEQVTNGITPINLEEEEKRFFSSNCAVNPTFAYEGRKCRMRIMRLFQRPSGTLLPLAEKILDSFIATYGSESRYLDEFGGDILSMEETKSIFQKYIDDLGLGSYIALRFSHNTVSPTSIAHSSKNSVSVVTIGLPIEYRRNRITGVLNHEIGTHFIRKFNDRLQPWHKSRGKFRLKRYTATEEGLASLNQLHDTVPIERKSGGRPRTRSCGRCCSSLHCTTTPAAGAKCLSQSSTAIWGSTLTTRSAGSRCVSVSSAV